jgi:hypothetical protein
MKVVLVLPTTALLMGCGNMAKSGAIVEAQNALKNSKCRSIGKHLYRRIQNGN